VALIYSRQRSDDTSGVLLGWDSNPDTNKFLVFEAELVKVSANITVIGTFKTVEGGSYRSDHMTAFNSELLSERSPHQSNSGKVEEFASLSNQEVCSEASAVAAG